MRRGSVGITPHLPPQELCLHGRHDGHQFHELLFENARHRLKFLVNHCEYYFFVDTMKLAKTVIATLALGAVAVHGLHLRGNSSDVTFGPKFTTMSTNYMAVDPQDLPVVQAAKEQQENATLAANLKKVMVEDRRAACAGTGRDCLTDNPDTIDQDNKVEDGPVSKETEPSTKAEKKDAAEEEVAAASGTTKADATGTTEADATGTTEADLVKEEEGEEKQVLEEDEVGEEPQAASEKEAAEDKSSSSKPSTQEAEQTAAPTQEKDEAAPTQEAEETALQEAVADLQAEEQAKGDVSVDDTEKKVPLKEDADIEPDAASTTDSGDHQEEKKMEEELAAEETAADAADATGTTKADATGTTVADTTGSSELSEGETKDLTEELAIEAKDEKDQEAVPQKVNEEPGNDVEK